jgi:hypothetical protein
MSDPDDESTSIISPWFNPEFREACRDYAWLINRDYPERGVLKLVGDRYRLVRDQRTILYRGICHSGRSAVRKGLLVTQLYGVSLTIDGYNVLFSLLNYRLGRATFIATDNILRDAGSLHGRLRSEDTFAECLTLLLDFIQSSGVARADIYLDSPVSHSERHAAEINRMLEARQLEGECRVVSSADYALKNSRGTVLATSDSGIIDKAMQGITDLPRMILESRYSSEIVKMEDLTRLPGTQ